MCGIVGFVGRGKKSNIIMMTERLRHRGPDGAGYHVDATLQVFLGHRRLSVLDIEGGAQPMWNEDGSVGIVFNGEIYNAPELREHLEAAGHIFATTHSDTEVLVHGYEEWGHQLPLRLNGMFAFAVFDKRRRKLFLARDRFGEKPLYYTQQHGLFAFCSEIKGFQEHPELEFTFEPRLIAKYFAYGFLPAPHTPYREILKLPAGGQMSVNLDDHRCDVQRYWEFRLEPDNNLRERDDERLVDTFRQLLLNAVRRRLAADVPLGVFLSGGLDSSSILWALRQFRSESDVKCFTVGFNESSFDETEYARIVANHFGCVHRVELLDLNVAKELFVEILRRMDDPISDGSLIPTFLLSRFCRREVTVALSGDGGDELLAGYDPFRAMTPARWYSACIPRPLHQMVEKLANRLPKSDANMSLDFKLRRTLLGLNHKAALWNPIWLSPADPRLLAEIMDVAPSAEELYSEAIELWESSNLANPLDKALEFYTRLYLQEDILVKVDRAAMMNSLETRAVFLDNDLVDFCRRLPAHFKLRNGVSKYIMKHAMRDLLPRQIIDRPKKGFGIPLASWLKEIPRTSPIRELPGFCPVQIERLWREHRQGTADHRLILWAWFALQYGLVKETRVKEWVS